MLFDVLSVERSKTRFGPKSFAVGRGEDEEATI